MISIIHKIKQQHLISTAAAAPVAAALGLGVAPEVLHVGERALGFTQGEQSELEKPVTRGGGDPVGIAGAEGFSVAVSPNNAEFEGLLGAIWRRGGVDAAQGIVGAARNRLCGLGIETLR